VKGPASLHDWPSCPDPTPYQIFDQSRHAPYDKARFYELVKLYHPDRRHMHSNAPSHAVCLERYQLVVAANEILGDPNKKRSYDLYGFGWGTKALMGNNEAFREADRSWRTRPGNASMNATWQDWERWYEAQTGEKQGKQRPVYVSNELFVVVLCAFVVVGSMGQARRARRSSSNVLELRDKEHEAISLKLRQREMEATNLGRHERIDSFLRQRESWNLAAERVQSGGGESRK
jgi:DnaJ-class molecular chaperone